MRMYLSTYFYVHVLKGKFRVPLSMVRERSQSTIWKLDSLANLRTFEMFIDKHKPMEGELWPRESCLTKHEIEMESVWLLLLGKCIED